MDDGKGKGFVTIAEHLSTQVVVKNGIERGRSYRFRYRARNSIGWSGYSPIETVLAAKVPDPPT